MASSNVAQKLKADKVVPDILDEAPNAKITIVYPNKKEVNFGEELTPTEVAAQPSVSWECKPDQYYTLSMVDPDVPTRENPTYGSINHWLVVNIKGNDLASGQTLVPYSGSKPRKTHGFHRYVFFVFQQSGQIQVSEPNIATQRRNFSIREFAKKYGLGKAIAGNYFIATWDSSIPEHWN